MVCRRLLVVAFAVVALLVVAGPVAAAQDGADGTGGPATAVRPTVVGANHPGGDAAGSIRTSSGLHIRVDRGIASGRTSGPAARANTVPSPPGREARLSVASSSPGWQRGEVRDAIGRSSLPARAGAPADAHEGHGHEAPCVMRADCAGALAVGGVGLLLALPAAAPSIGALTPAGPVVASPSGPHPAARAGRLFRPPRTS